MKPKLRQCALVAAIGGLSLLPLGCGSAGRSWPNVGTYTFLSGEFCGMVDGPLDKVVPATEAALRERGVAPKTRRDEKTATFRGKDAMGRDVLVRVRAQSDRACWLCIVIGTVGDEDQSAALLGRIRSGL